MDQPIQTNLENIEPRNEQHGSKEAFAIKASSCTLKFNNQLEGDTILGKGTTYCIPIYQRPYSWTEHQIKKFIGDLFTSFSADEEGIGEPMFIGTMQLSAEKENGEKDIIDGQQRLTTFVLLFKL